MVSPAYGRTGVVVALTSATGSCTQNCEHLWVTRDGGGSWRRASATGWQPGRFDIAVDASGHEAVFSGSGSAVQRSDDLGETWTTAGAAGSPVVAPTYTADGAVAVAGDSDYVLHGTTSDPVRGSGGGISDLSFMYAPHFPQSGSHAPALLSGADPQTKNPVIQQCTTALSCSGATTLPGAGTFSAPVTLLASTAYDRDGVVFAQSGRGIYKSVDGGLTFAPIPIVPDNGATATATPMLQLGAGYSEGGPVRTAYAAVLQAYIDATNPSNSHSAGGIFRSDDGGAQWRSVSAGTLLDGGATAVAVTPDGRMFAGYVQSSTGSTGLLCNAGSGWAPTCPPTRNASQSGVTPAAVSPPGSTCAAGRGCASAPAPNASAAAGSASSTSGATATASGSGPAGGGAPAAAGAATAATSGGSRIWVKVAGYLLALAVLLVGAEGIRRYARGRSRAG